ncbi:MAG: RNA polymerase sporulation sigma factor SigK [Bacilli bacterium]|nr:RNA polymerase sporulation sigma factor SigK [Bacilli bacterium]
MFLFDLIKELFCFTGSYSNDIFLEPLSSEEEEYCIKNKDSDVTCRNKLIEHNLRLVAHITKKYDTKLIDNDDLISIGTIGLIKGVDTFKDNKKVKITTYCARCIENEILMYFRKNNKYSKDISINEAVGYDKDGNEIEIQDIIQVENTDFCDDIDLKDNIKSLYKYINVLNPREKRIIIKRYGLDNTREETQKSISKKLGISRSYVSRIEKRALTKLLREFLKEKDK